MHETHDIGHTRISRELFLAAFGAPVVAFESWVTDRFVSLLEETEARPGETIFAAGDSPECFYFMREGRLHLVREGHPNRTLEGRSVFGVLDGLVDRARTRTAIAATHLKLMRVHVDAWLDLLDDSFELARASVLELARNVATLQERADSLPGEHGPGPARAPKAAPRVPPGRLNVIERLALLMEVGLLRSAGVQPVSDLAVASQDVRFGPGETLFDRGTPRDRLYLVIEGEVEATREAPHVVRRAMAGEIVCGAASFGEPALAWKAVARGPVRTLAFRVDDWFDLMEEHFDMVRSALAALSLAQEGLLEKQYG